MAPATTQPAATDGRVRTPVFSLQEQVEHLHFNEAPARCKSPCCAPRPYSMAGLRPSPKRDTLSRPALNRNAASHFSASSGKSCYSMGTDGSHVQSEDGFAEFGDMVDSATFEQVRKDSLLDCLIRWIGILMLADPRNGRRRRRARIQQKHRIRFLHASGGHVRQDGRGTVSDYSQIINSSSYSPVR